MDKEILEITKKFHDTYEKLASEYTYETREDTKVFDINSNNGKLMYATVNEIVSPILKGNKILEENYDKIYNENCKLREEHNITDISLLDENYKLKDKISKIETLIINHNCDTGDIYYKYNSKFLKSELKQRILEILEDKEV